MSKSLTGRLQISIKHITQLTPHEVSDRNSVIVHIVLNYSQDHHTDSAFIIETILF